ncbi:MAG: methyltransferase domain-containing protein [Polyangiaceae bacterium]
MGERAAGKTFLTHAPEALYRLGWAYADAPQAAVDRAEAALGAVPWHSDVEIVAWICAEPFHAMVALALVADSPLSIAGRRVAEVLPELAGLAAPHEVTTYEHQAPNPGGRPTPLLDRVLRALSCADREVATMSAADRATVTTALVFSDVAKGGSPTQRESWRVRLGVDGTVHNEDSAVIFEDVTRRILGKAPLSDDGRWVERARVLIATSGLLGMRLRGEVGRESLAPLVELFQKEHDLGEAFSKVWSIVNHCETQAVRAGLWTPELQHAFHEEERTILLCAQTRAFTRTPLAERIARMRGGALMRCESSSQVDEALSRLRGAREIVESRLARCAVWYAEPALGALSIDACVRLLAHLTGAAVASGIDITRPWHLDLMGIGRAVRDRTGLPRRYPVRLLETLLDATPAAELLQGKLGQRGQCLLSFPSTKGGEQAIAVSFQASEEAGALLTLLAIYENKGSVDFHHTLKALCDLYGLRKDDYDRVHNEAAYLGVMNSARSDKARMLDFVKQGTIVEVGPGGGVVLELLAERFHGSKIVGIDASKAVVESHQSRNAGRALAYEMIHGDAFELPKIVGRSEVTTVIFCSVLHEIFSYVEWGQPPARFQLEAVDAIVGAAFRSLARGGRIIVRDGVAPVDEPRVLELTNPEWREGLELFRAVYEPRRITFTELGDGRVRIGARDLYEFLTTITWGPDSFPYEIREQRAILSRADYVERLVAACRAADPEYTAREVPVPADLASYLQPGYPEHVRPHARIFDASGEREVSMPDVNGVIVIEKS